MTVARLLMDRGRSSRPEPGTARTPTASAAHKYAHGINAEALAPRGGPTDPTRALSALRSIPVPEDRGEWLRLAFATHAAGVPFDNFLDSCRAGPNFTNDADVRKAWDSFDPTRPNGIGAGTLFHIARQHGWADPTRAVIPMQAANDASSNEHIQPTDLWLARYFSQQCRAHYRFDHSVKQWRKYRAGSWSLCRKAKAPARKF